VLVGLSRLELATPDPQTSAACPRTSKDVRFSLKIRILHWAHFGGHTQMVVKMVVRLIATLIAKGPLNPGLRRRQV
jgi:hypothetical protein